MPLLILTTPVPFLTGVAATTALSAYLNAKYHILHDLRSDGGGLSPTRKDLDWIASKAASKQTLTYYILRSHSQSQPNHPFLIFEDRTYTYAQFFSCLTRVGNWLIDELEIEIGEVVAVDGGNSPEYLMLWFALDAIGAVTSFVNWNLTGEGLVHCVKLCESRYLITDQDVRNNVEPCREQLEERGLKIKYYDPQFFSSLTNTTPIPDSRRESVTIESIRGLVYTSGTTGLPKGVIMTTGRELLVGRLTAKYLAIKPSDRMYTCMPLYHGAAHVAKNRATIIQYVGELCRYLLSGPKNEFERKHVVKMAWGNGMRPDVWEPFRERFGIPIINELYAATDGLGATFNRNEGPFTANAIGLRGSIWNWRYSDKEIRVKMDVDTEDIMRDENGFAIRCGVNEPGQVLHRLDPEMLAGVPGYFNNDQATVNRRITDVFEKGDMSNVSTNEVADMVGKFPQIAETNVYGVSVPGYDGRVGAACIVMAEGVTEPTFDFQGLAKHARAVLPGYAVPLFLRLTSALEYTGTMKIQKGRLKKEGVDPHLVSGDDGIFWLPPGSDRYLPFERNDWEAIKAKSVRLT
ncbi:long-chain fatty acid transporter-like protein [Zopfia rhizophila CBS 207.26]|uniref:Long-chain fatty acid transporter-like protein n=1 Tax=Zopfia rhizophila CBS 207.26 TaxID=1314779 RepID=A0A6A6EGY1_9PEZI|nr:long-chain fatty acid transporter-like protein [Zopfia rhizophila CBS 207.26]